MRTASRIAFLLFAAAVFGSAALAQALVIDRRAQAVERVEPVWPATPVSDSYGGAVSVVVSLDNAGNVISVEPADGPGPVCASANNPEIAAIREAARTAAFQSKYSPATENGVASASKIIMTYNFLPPAVAAEEVSAAPPTAGVKRASSAEPNRYTVKGDSNYPVADAPPPDYRGPVNTGGPRPKTLSGGVLNGKAIALPKPAYPPAARAVRADGTVNVQVLITEEGTVFSAKAVSGHPLLRSASRLAACGAQFSPVVLSGVPVKFSGVIVYNFIP